MKLPFEMVGMRMIRATIFFSVAALMAGPTTGLTADYEQKFLPSNQTTVQFGKLRPSVQLVNNSKAETLQLQLNLNLNGLWKLTELRTAGAYSGGDERRARKLIGSKISILNSHGSFPDGTNCNLVSAQQVALKDDMMTFGSAGGSWAKLGLTQAPDYT